MNRALSNEQQLEAILEALTTIVRRGEYQPLPVEDGQSALDAIHAGINMLAEEVEINLCELEDRVRIANEEVERRLAIERLLRSAVAEKDALLREVHHRVKNSLQLVMSLLRLQAEATEPAVAAPLREASSRVRAIAAVHEHTYRAADVANIDMANYLAELMRDLQRLWGSREITLHLEGGHRVETVERAVPIGLLITELIMNSFKHAFPGGRRGSIAVRLGPDHYEIADDGVGGSPDAPCDGIGLELVRSLAGQIGASVTIDSTRGFRVRIAPCKEAVP